MANRPLPHAELALIAQIRRDFAQPKSRSVTLGIGDDCAILSPRQGLDVVVTTDFTLEGRHFSRDLHPPESVGHRCLARGLSDLAAMGATPIAAFLSLALPNSLIATSGGRLWITRFLRGMNNLATRFAVPLAGGDTAESPCESIFADITLIGTTPKNRALRRSTARPGDLIYVTGSLGGAAAELETMLSRKSSQKNILRTSNHPQLFPEPRLAVAQTLLRNSLATSCIDLSDGLSSDLPHLCEESGVGAGINVGALPLHTLASIPLALNGGEDYELLFTAKSQTRIPRRIGNIPITAIGRITEKLSILLMENGSARPLPRGGWEHFAKKAGKS